MGKCGCAEAEEEEDEKQEMETTAPLRPPRALLTSD